MTSLTIAVVFVGVLASITEISGVNGWNLCNIPKDTQRCRIYYPLWGFDEFQKKCVRYTHAGCEDFDTGYRSENKCKEMCEGIIESTTAEIDADGAHGENYDFPIANNEFWPNLVKRLKNPPVPLPKFEW